MGAAVIKLSAPAAEIVGTILADAGEGVIDPAGYGEGESALDSQNGVDLPAVNQPGEDAFGASARHLPYTGEFEVVGNIILRQAMFELAREWIHSAQIIQRFGIRVVAKQREPMGKAPLDAQLNSVILAVPTRIGPLNTAVGVVDPPQLSVADGREAPFPWALAA